MNPERVSREHLERIARIVGPASAAQQALDYAAAKHDGECVFYRVGSAWLVGRLPNEAEANHPEAT